TNSEPVCRGPGPRGRSGRGWRELPHPLPEGSPPTTAPSAQSSPVDHRSDAALADRIEGAWQRRWAEGRTFSAPNPVGDLATPANQAAADRATRDHVYLMDMFPYPSGRGLHVGHPLGYLATDVYARFHRM